MCVQVCFSFKYRGEFAIQPPFHVVLFVLTKELVAQVNRHFLGEATVQMDVTGPLLLRSGGAIFYVVGS